MIDGLGVASCGVRGIAAEAAMLGQPMSMVLHGVVGFKLTGKLQNDVTAIYSVLTVTQMLRKHGVVSKFADFYGEGIGELSLADRATISFFLVDHVTLQYLKLSGRSNETECKFHERGWCVMGLWIIKILSDYRNMNISVLIWAT